MKTDSKIGGGTSARRYRHPLLCSISLFLQCLQTAVDPAAKRRLRWTPQAFITTVAEVHSGLLWDWRVGRARASERQHLMEMIPDLPDDALLLADAGFVCLPIWERLNTAGKHFLIRVGSNVHLLTDLWPHAKTRTPGESPNTLAIASSPKTPRVRTSDRQTSDPQQPRRKTMR